MTDSTSLAGNCRDHFDRTVALLPHGVPLLFDGKSACNSVAGLADERWTDLGRFADSEGKPKQIRMRRGTLAAPGGERNFIGWNIPANYLGKDALVRIGEWLRSEFPA